MSNVVRFSFTPVEKLPPIDPPKSKAFGFALDAVSNMNPYRELGEHSLRIAQRLKPLECEVRAAGDAMIAMALLHASAALEVLSECIAERGDQTPPRGAA